MNRYLEFFEPRASGAMRKALERAFESGARKAIVIVKKTCGQKLIATLQKTGFSWVERPVAAFRNSDIADADLVLVPAANGHDVSSVLHACIDRDVTIIAPVTEHHCTRRTVFLMSIPKAGTHMVIRLLHLMGLVRSPERAPQPGTWSTPVGYHYHAPCKDLVAGDWFDPIGRQLLFRSPGIFVYRNPLDIVISELDWFSRPEHTFSGYLNCGASKSEQLDRLIADNTVMGTIRDRINRYAGWMNFNNIIPVSYEELVGTRGGGNDVEQQDTIWAMQLKLHIPGSPFEYGSQLYDPGSATFSKGRIGRHRDYFEEHHFTLVDSLPQDFMQSLGYTRGTMVSSKVLELKQRPLIIKALSSDCLNTPRLVRESLLGWNIIEVAGKYFPVQQGVSIKSADDAKAISTEQEGFIVLRDAVDAVIHGDVVTAATAADPPATELVVEGYCEFNILRHNGMWWGFDQAVGPMDISCLSEATIETMKLNGSCVTGESLADVKTEILAIVIRQTKQPTRALQKDFIVVPEVGDSVIHDDIATTATTTASELSATELVIEGYCGFNILWHDGTWCGFAQAEGSMDISSLSEEAIEDMKSRGSCVIGENLADVKIEILAILIRQTEQRQLALQEELSALNP